MPPACRARRMVAVGGRRAQRGASRTSTPAAIVRGWPPPRLASMRLFRQRRPPFFEPGPIAMPVAIRKQPFVKFERAIACARAFRVRRGAVAATSAVATAAAAAARVNDQGSRESRKGFFLDAPGEGRTCNTAASPPVRTRFRRIKKACTVVVRTFPRERSHVEKVETRRPRSPIRRAAHREDDTHRLLVSPRTLLWRPSRPVPRTWEVQGNRAARLVFTVFISSQYRGITQMSAAEANYEIISIQ